MEAVISLMEQKAALFPITSRGVFSLLETKDKDETLQEIEQLKPILITLSKELREAREVVSQKEKQFTHLAHYKYLLERTIILPRLVVTRKKKEPSEIDNLLTRLEALTPAQLEKLEGIEL